MLHIEPGGLMASFASCVCLTKNVTYNRFLHSPIFLLKTELKTPKGLQVTEASFALMVTSDCTLYSVQ